MPLIKKTHGLTLEMAKIAISYDPGSGCFARRNGSPAGHVTEAGYLRITIDRKRHMAHRLAWLFTHGEWPDFDIDHADGDRLNNRASNLRRASRAQNTMNSKLRSDNPTMLKGARARKDRKTFAAVIRINGKQKTLGYFETPEAAHAAYVDAAKVHFGEFARAQ